MGKTGQQKECFFRQDRGYPKIARLIVHHNSRGKIFRNSFRKESYHMGRNKKVDPLELQGLRNKGLGVVDIAKKLGIPKGTVSKNVKLLPAYHMQDQAFRAIARVQGSDLDPMGKLRKIVAVIEDELDKIRIELETTKTKGPLRELQLKHSAEIRQQIQLLLEISTALYRIEETEAFKKIVLEELGRESPELRDRILKRIKKRKKISEAVEG
jgi:hypothetical protein